MAQQEVHDHVGDQQQRSEASSLLGGFVERASQIEQQRSHLDQQRRQLAENIEEATSQQFEGRSEPVHIVGRHLAETSEAIDSEYGEELDLLVDETIAAHGEGLESQVDMTDSDQLNPIVEQVALGVFPTGAEDIRIGRIAALLSYCYRLIKKLFRPKVVLGVAIGAGAVGMAAFILYKVFVKIDFFGWLLREGGWVRAFLKSAGQNAVDGIGNAINRTGRRCFEFLRSIVGVGVTISSTTMGTVNRIRAVPPGLTTQMSHAILRTARLNRAGLLISVVPTAIYISVYYWWTRKSQ